MVHNSHKYIQTCPTGRSHIPGALPLSECDPISPGGSDRHLGAGKCCHLE